MSKSRGRLSSLEVLLSVVVVLLLAVCVGLAVVSWLAISHTAPGDEMEQTELSGTLTIIKGMEFTPELLNSSSAQFKSLAYDTERLISGAYSQSSLKDQYLGCDIQNFRQGSVVVTFALSLRGVVESTEAQKQLVRGLQSGGVNPGGLVVDPSSVMVSEKPDPTSPRPTTVTNATTPNTVNTPSLTTTPEKPDPTSPRPTTVTNVTTLNTVSTPSLTTTPVHCSESERMCGDFKQCVALPLWCDGVKDCQDGTDEDKLLCATACDGKFVLSGPEGSFHSENFPLPYENERVCRWIIWVEHGFSIKVDFQSFHTEQDTDVLTLYEGLGTKKVMTFSLSGSTPPGTLWLLSDEATVVFSTDYINTLSGFNATFRAQDLRTLSNEQKVRCSFEEGMCFWRQEPEDDGDWERVQGPTFPPTTGPSADHTMGNASAGFYVITPSGFGNWERSFRLHSLPLVSSEEPVCLSFWYHMYGTQVSSLSVGVKNGSSYLQLFHKEDNYGDNWNYGQITLNVTSNITVVFEAQKSSSRGNDIALDDINLISGACEGGPPEPTAVPKPTTPPPIPPDCGGPFDLWEPNSTFCSPNYPHNYGNKASCIWNLHAQEGRNIQLHFLDFALEAAYDVMEVRDGPGPEAVLLGVFTGERTFPDVFSATNQITVMLFTDSSGADRGFCANFSSGIQLGQPEPCLSGQFQCGSGECVARNSSVCNGVPDCPDASDEAQCVHMLPVGSVNSTDEARLHVQMSSSLYAVCAQNWTSDLSQYFCRYLGYRSGEASSMLAREEESQFISVSLRPDGSTHVESRDACPENMVVALSCNNQPCGVRKISIKTQSGLLDDGEMREKEETEEMKEEKKNRVVGGEDAVKGAWPWVVSLSWQGRHVCGASLIDKDWLITAAHCVFGKNIHLSNWVAVLGLHSQYGSDYLDRQNLQVDQIIMNEHYNRRTKQADIALMHLKTPANFTDYVQPVCLPYPEQRFETGKKCFIAGWGRLEEGGDVPDVLQQAVLPLVDQALCQKQLPEYNITAQMVCAGFPEGGVDSCQGDSGGPLMCEEDGRWILVGATSFGVGCGRPGRPGVYARVSEFIDWVVETRRQRSHWEG